MKHTVKNLINSPYDVVTVDGPERIPARGELTAEFDERSLAIIRQMGYFEVKEAGATEPKRDPLDHDGDGVKGGFNTFAESVKESLEIEQVAEDEPSETPVVETETAPDVTQPKRRGRPPKKAD